MTIIHFCQKVFKSPAHPQRLRRPNVGGLAVISAMVLAVMTSSAHAQDISEKSAGAAMTPATGDAKAKNIILFSPMPLACRR